MPFDPVYTTGQVASMLQVTARTVSTLCDKGAIPCYRVGDRRRIVRSGLVAYMEKTGIPLSLLPEAPERFTTLRGQVNGQG